MNRMATIVPFPDLMTPNPDGTPFLKRTDELAATSRVLTVALCVIFALTAIVVVIRRSSS